MSLRAARAEDSSACRRVERSNVIQCTLERSIERRAAGATVEAAGARVIATRPWFPVPPTLSLSGARRTAGTETALNWSASLAVELELAGQRGARRRAALTEKEADERRLLSVERTTAAQAWHEYFDTLAGHEARALAQRLEAASMHVWEAARARVERGALAGVEADLAEAAYLRTVQRRIEADREERRARAALAARLGFEAAEAIAVVGSLEPLRAAERAPAPRPNEPPEAAALEAEARAYSARADAQRRSRVPNPSLSAFAERDGFNENVVGLGVAFPLPLPEPLGRMHRGEIAESEALARRAKLLALESRRRFKSDLLQAQADYDSARATTRLYTIERLARAESTLASLAAEVEAARLSARDAVLLEEPLFDLLFNALAARRALCLASVDVAWAAGLDLEDKP